MYGAERVVALPKGTLEQYDLPRDGLNKGAFSHPARVKIATIDILVVKPLCTRALVGAHEPDADPVDVPARAHGATYPGKAQTGRRTAQQLANDLAQQRQILH